MASVSLLLTVRLLSGARGFRWRSRHHSQLHSFTNATLLLSKTHPLACSSLSQALTLQPCPDPVVSPKLSICLLSHDPSPTPHGEASLSPICRCPLSLCSLSLLSTFIKTQPALHLLTYPQAARHSAEHYRVG